MLKPIPVFDGDRLFVEKRKESWQTIKSHKECAKLAYEFVVDTFNRQVDVALNVRKDFIYEGHFTKDATWDIPRQLMSAGYRSDIFFLGLAVAELSEARVTKRSLSGGHYVDPQTVKDNFYGNLDKLREHYGLFDTVQIIDASDPEHSVLAIFGKGQPVLAVPAKDLPNWFRNFLPEMALKIEEEEVGRDLS